jgi:hypothetical protein
MTGYTARQPSAALKGLERLVGRWQISGPSITGQSAYEWMEGGHFLIQRVETNLDGHPAKGVEMIGHERPFGAEAPSAEVKSRFYDTEGNTLDYVYELEGDTLTIWGGEKGSPAYYQGRFSADGDTLVGAWHWPGGGYAATSTRVR